MQRAKQKILVYKGKGNSFVHNYRKLQTIRMKKGSKERLEEIQRRAYVNFVEQPWHVFASDV